MSELIISVSGLRGVVGETLTPDVAMKYVAAFSAGTESGPFVITRDGRASGEMLAHAIHAALNATGRSTIEAGIAATPSTGILIRSLNAAGGIQISASHNPGEYNGIKLFSGDGRVIPKEPGSEVLTRYKQGRISWAKYNELGKQSVCEDTTSAHLQKVLATVDVERIRRRRFRVLLDANRGAGSVLGRLLLEQLGCETIVLGGEPDGQFEHTPEPTVENLQSVFQQVKDMNVDVGFCQDPDADRLAVIDHNGRYLGEEYTLALCVKHLLQHHKERNRRLGSIVINCATSRMSQDIAEYYGVPILRSPVGEANVVDLMLAENAMFGGEGNGGPIDPHVGFVRDSFVGMVQILDAMVLRDKTIAELADELPLYAIVKRKTTVSFDRIPTILNTIERKFSAQQCNRQDGLRIDWPDSWVLIRASNTEPILRIIAESQTEDRANELCDLIQREMEFSV